MQTRRSLLGWWSWAFAMYQLRERSGSCVCQLVGEAVKQTHDRCKSRLGKMWWRVPAEAERDPPVAGGWDGCPACVLMKWTRRRIKGQGERSVNVEAGPYGFSSFYPCLSPCSVCARVGAQQLDASRAFTGGRGCQGGLPNYSDTATGKQHKKKDEKRRRERDRDEAIWRKVRGLVCLTIVRLTTG